MKFTQKLMTSKTNQKFLNLKWTKKLKNSKFISIKNLFGIDDELKNNSDYYSLKVVVFDKNDDHDDF